MSKYAALESSLGEHTTGELRPEIAAAYRDAKARGLPDGWTCTIDKRNRRKWTAPNNGRSCDSIPKALAISVDLGLLPPDTKIQSGKRKRSATPKSHGRPPKKSSSCTASAFVKSAPKKEPPDEEEPPTKLEPPSEPLDPETSLDGSKRKSSVTPKTVHWDPDSPDGRKVGWRVHIAYPTPGDHWARGRIVRYDPHSHKHKLLLDDDKNKNKNSTVWIWLRNQQHNLQIATRMVWAHVKGYAWWPALVMETNDTRRAGYVQVEFFGSGEISTLRDTPECIRPFSPYAIDPVVAKHKKRRNQAALAAACEEYHAIRRTRNEAALYYAQKAVGLANLSSSSSGAYVGQRIQLFRSDVNYPYGDWVVGTVRKYSALQRKWLVSYDFSTKTRQKYAASWINLQTKECAVKTLNNNDDEDVSNEDERLIPYLVGFQAREDDTKADDDDDETNRRERALVDLLTKRCRGCVEYLKKDDPTVVCQQCQASCHLACFDPPLSLETWQRLKKTSIVCSHCTPCRGCYQKDIVFGSHVNSTPTMLSFPAGESLDLCWPCRQAYDDDRFCPNCAHTWDDVRFQTVTRQIEWAATGPRKRSKPIFADTELPLVLGSFTGDEVWPKGAQVDPALFHPETSEWGYTEVDMLVCDSCAVWVHAGCAGISEDEYEETSDGNHPIYSKEFLCRMCCRQRCKDIIAALQKADTHFLFAEPVTERVAPNYHDVIKTPIDLQTILEKADSEEYLNYAWVRELFELMVLNALTFNRQYTKLWNEARRYYQNAINTIFDGSNIGKAAPPGKYAPKVEKQFALAEEARKKEEDRVQVDESVEKKDSVAGSMASATSLPKLRESPPDQKSCVPFHEVELTPVDAFYSSWMDTCFTCGSSGAADTLLFCVDCGEAFHSFCANAPIHSMSPSSVCGWRCPNCKCCECSGDVPQETRMLYCEMCDRGFCLDLLDPPLSSAPPGLWICGQCVDCTSCGNISEPSGASIRHWSRCPDRCYRCGGCEGLDESCISTMQCQVCIRPLRSDDSAVAECHECGCKVHSKCDQHALEHVLSMESASRAQRAQKEKHDLYLCPTCSKVPKEIVADIASDRRLLRSLAQWGITSDEIDGLGSNEDINEQLIDAMDWSVREQWRHEYIATIRDGICAYRKASQKLGDPRLAPQQLSSADTDFPLWKIQRARRFVVLVKRRKLDGRGCAFDHIDSIVLTAKLAASFLEVACRVLQTDGTKINAPRNRMLVLSTPPTVAGTYDLPFDSLRASKMTKHDSVEVNHEEESVLSRKESESPQPGKKSIVKPTPETVKMASPLCGWTQQISAGRNQSEWKDPRECCLCHLCGDDDAGFMHPDESDRVEDSLEFSPLGRLLPMPEGYWVHTSCALWSSEVWEAPDDGLLHSVEKARSRGAQLKCFGCGRPGATVGCCKGNCPFNYHFPCAKVCGAVFTENQRVYCSNHKTAATNLLVKESFEHMKTLLIAPDEKKVVPDKDSSDTNTSELCLRVGALTVHSLGHIDAESDKFHSENYITPEGYVATRIFWSSVHPRKRTLYVLKIRKSALDRPEFTILSGDDPSTAIHGNSVSTVYSALVDRVRKVNLDYFSQGDLYSKLPVIRRTRKKAFGLNGPQFFGFGLDQIRKRLESGSGVESLVVPLTPSSPKYRFCFVLPDSDSLLSLQRKRAAAKAERALENSSGCARTEGIKAVVRSGGSGRITRALVRSAEEDVVLSAAMTKKGEEKLKADRNLIQLKYRRMKSVPIEERLVARRSHIHGWGLFTKSDLPKDSPIVEYMGEIIRQPIGDMRERAYEISGEGSCYMFRLDLQRIVDATKIGCMARFMNHSCQPNAYAKIISVDTDQGQDRKIVVFANRDITAGEEITYDYKFPVEDGSLRCSCGAPTCIGRLN